MIARWALGWVVVWSTLAAGCTSGVDGPERTPAVTTAGDPLDLDYSHDFSGPVERFEFVVNRPTPTHVALWFEGVFAGSGEMTISLVDASHAVAAKSMSPSGFVGGAVGGRSFVVTRNITLAPGSWAVDFSGQGPPTGRAKIGSG